MRIAMPLRPATFALAFALSGAAIAGGIPESLDATNYRRLSPSLAVAGRPSPEALAKLKELGFRTAIDLRQPAEGVEAAREAVEKQGLTFVSVPVSPDTFRADDAKKVAAVLDEAKAGPVLLYCSSSNRVGAVIAVIEGLRGKPHDEALAEGRKAGLKSAPMIDAVERVLAKK